jgi:hypothetical protein
MISFDGGLGNAGRCGKVAAGDDGDRIAVDVNPRVVLKKEELIVGSSEAHDDVDPLSCQNGGLREVKERATKGPPASR